ncbi:flagellar hook-length control protein FliK [Shewanella sp. D64]|uniref:flagellar hook-length control protein FliK n=1 Tax=unclassified Shewanella TaxID=196818 RepID=UPI0022BA4315|nr:MULTISPECIES: flagellar hook-length control protein FliK [unclassified Shewanella]MEC4726506.1 flagellar hook-length control protein FliK [Shewanella sp. D64]MEC4737453.1 flagellar hook-length control protein FliK [Shewanella sp. E94]WBJ97267.1 flagellar hook-length control protein FliK [Shewanella sp. MTB7]
MQKMSNVLLASNKAENKPNTEIKQAVNDNKSSENSDFSSALQQASVEAKQQVKIKSNESVSTKVELDNASNINRQTDAEEQALIESQHQNGSSTEGETDVSHVLAQINLASELNNADRVVSTVIIEEGGDSLPLGDLIKDEVLIDSLGLNITEGTEKGLGVLDPATAEPLDNKTLTELLNKSGLTLEELQTLSPEVLTQLITFVKSGEGNVQDILDVRKQVEILAGDGVKNHQATYAQNKAMEIDASKNEPALVGSAAEKERPQGQTLPAIETKPLNTAQLQQVELNKEQSLVLDNKGQLSSFESKAMNVQGQETAFKSKGESVKLNSILGEKLASQTEGQVVAEEQLKGAELSVKLTPMKAGMEFGSAFTETAVESKLQQASSQLTPQQTTRSDIAQIQLSLKQSNEQQVQMQDMIQRFSPVMKQQLITMVSQGIQHAEIRLDPPELGQLMVRIQVQGDQTQVQFQVAQHQTRDLIEQAIPRLKELLSEQGLQLTDSQVSQENEGNGADGEQNSEDSGSQFGTELDEISSEESLISSKQATSYPSGIDYYA